MGIDDCGSHGHMYRVRCVLVLVSLQVGILVAVFQQLALDIARSTDPDVYYDAIQMITSNGYSAEAHNITTNDGYVLTAHRIPSKCQEEISINQVRCSGAAVLLMHCVLCSSDDWLMNMKNGSFGYLLADAGFDVWMANVRGNTYSRRHINFTTEDTRFWEFSWQEHALSDLPAMVDYILRVSGQKQIYYVGHSQGTTMGFAAFSHDQKLASKIKVFYALAPVINLHHIGGAAWVMSKVLGPIHFLFSAMSAYGEVLVADSLFNRISSVTCSTMLRIICTHVVEFLAGTTNNLNETRLPVYVKHTPAGTSIKNMYHWSQLAFSGFCLYDYGPASNTVHYGQKSPPCFNLTNLHVPVALFSGAIDRISMPKHVISIAELIKPILLFHKHIPHYGHVDFIWGMDAPTEIYQVIIKHMKDSENIIM